MSLHGSQEMILFPDKGGHPEDLDKQHTRHKHLYFKVKADKYKIHTKSL